MPGPTALRAFIIDRNLVETFLNCYRPFDGHIVLEFTSGDHGRSCIISRQDRLSLSESGLMTCHVKSAVLGLRHG